VKYFDDESSSINLNIEESRERMDRFMPTRMSLLKESLISDTQKRNHNYGKISFIKINIIYFVLKLLVINLTSSMRSGSNKSTMDKLRGLLIWMEGLSSILLVVSLIL